MITATPVTLEGHGIRLEPLAPAHRDGLSAAAGDGRLWELWYAFVPEPGQTETYIADALAGQRAGHMMPWAVRELSTGAIAGSTRFHDIMPSIDRVEIGYTWYASRWQRSHVNTACKLVLLTHAFEALGCRVVGFRTDNFNVASQKAIEALGARKDGVIRHHQARRDGRPRAGPGFRPLPTVLGSPLCMSITVYVPPPLRVYCGRVSEISLSAPTVRAALEELERSHPSLYVNICDETGKVRRHINLFVNTSHVRDRDGLDTALAPGDVLTILPAVSGG